MLIPFDRREEYAKTLKAGLRALGPEFTAIVCWWCDGTGVRNFEHCGVCGRGVHYACNNGLLWPGSVPAPDSVAHQVINAALSSALREGK